MAFQKAVVQILASDPCRTLLTRIARIPFGKRVLNAISSPYGVYSTFEDGWTTAQKTIPVGHEDPGEIEVHLRHAQSLRPSDYAALYWISKIHPRNPKMFDFGGNIGNLYYSYSPQLLELGNVEWTVFDIPSVVECGRKIAEERSAAGLQFVNSVSTFKPEQILLVSGAFHYWERDLSEFVEQFPIAPRHIIINRSPFHERQPSFITVQHTKSCAFPCRVWNVDEVIAGFKGSGYKLMDHWRAPELSLKLPLFPDWSVPYYSGFYFSRANHSS